MKKLFFTTLFVFLLVGFSAAQSLIKKTGLNETDRAKWFNVLKWEEEDYIQNIARYENAGFTFHKLDHKKYLVEIITSSAAYQRNYVYAILDERDWRKPIARLLNFTTYFVDEENGKIIKESNQVLIGISSFDLKRKTLKMYYKGAGLGHCGSLETYKIVADKARIVESRHRGCGNATNVPPPEKWEKIKIF